MIQYRFDETVIEVQERRDGAETEFRIRLLQAEPYAGRMKDIQRRFEDNEDYTDALFYVYPDHAYKIIVRDAHYADFLTALFKAKLILSLAWAEA
ncbi:hypothetical protein [Paenibacillus methanolicus]|uniref:Uncharacterized protein n=1 Tax=Paenibacillus methanolicus TaxID=582686 RepID=A0A5S5C641_9BACL|nr:hypothetical protein [Paenibacillus methanolicus]TYP74901.1 hypothetical protein BCM02_105448 [Paenibacillus methanolicus]